MDKEAILNSLDVKTFYASQIPSIKWNSSMWGQGLCPFHKDQKPSFFANKETGAFHCKGCDKRGSIFDFYMEKYNIDFKTACNALAKEAGLTTEPERKIVKTYDYTDESGNLLFQTVRYEPKDFKQRRPDGNGGWIWNLEDVRLVPYNLPAVLKAEDVIIIEGENDADNLNAFGFIATTNPLGASKWKSEYNQYFKDKKIVTIPDNDDPGKRHAQTVAKNLKDITESVKIVELAGLPEKGDVSNWIAQGHTKKELIEIFKQTPEWTPEEPKSLLDSLLKWNDIFTLNVKTEYLLDKLIPKGSITLFFGKGGIGKTSLALQLSRAVAEGLPFGDLQTIKTSVYFIDFENPLAVLKQRVEFIGAAADIYVWHISNDPMPPRLDSKQWELYKQLPSGLLVFDTLRAAHLSDENNSQDMALVIAKLKELREAGFTILLLHHTPKGNEGIYKGSTALLDLVDHVISLEAVRDPDGEAIEFDKENLYRLGVRIKTRYEPHHIFLKFNPDIKGFEIARDPDIEKIETIYEILKETPTGLKQKDLKEKIKTDFELTENHVRRLLKKGEGIAWDVHKGGDKNRALIYIPKSNRIIGGGVNSSPINQLNSETDIYPSNKTVPDSMQSLDNTELDNATDSEKPINQLEVIDMEHEEVEIVE